MNKLVQLSFVDALQFCGRLNTLSLVWKPWFRKNEFKLCLHMMLFLSS